MLKGTLDINGDEEKLNRMLYGLLNRSEKHAFILMNKRNITVNSKSANETKTLNSQITDLKK